MLITPNPRNKKILIIKNVFIGLLSNLMSKYAVVNTTRPLSDIGNARLMKEFVAKFSIK